MLYQLLLAAPVSHGCCAHAICLGSSQRPLHHFYTGVASWLHLDAPSPAFQALECLGSTQMHLRCLDAPTWQWIIWAPRSHQGSRLHPDVPLPVRLSVLTTHQSCTPPPTAPPQASNLLGRHFVGR